MITPYEAQRDYIEDELRKKSSNGGGGLTWKNTVFTVDSFQGGFLFLFPLFPWPLLLPPLVFRLNKQPANQILFPIHLFFLSLFRMHTGNEEDYIIISLTRTQQLGFLNDIRRSNVMLSRAKEGMYIVTNAGFFFHPLMKVVYTPPPSSSSPPHSLAPSPPLASSLSTSSTSSESSKSPSSASTTTPTTSIFSPVSTTSTLPTSCGSCGTRTEDESGCECGVVEESKESQVLSSGPDWSLSDEEQDQDQDWGREKKNEKGVDSQSELVKVWLKSPNTNTDSPKPLGAFNEDEDVEREEGEEEFEGGDKTSDDENDRDGNNVNYDSYGGHWEKDNKTTDRSKLYLHIPRGIRVPVRNRNRGQTWAQNESSPGQDQDQDQDQDQSQGHGQGQGREGRQGTIDKKYIKAFSRVRGTLVGKMAEEWGKVERGWIRFDLERIGMGKRAREKARGRGRGWSENANDNRHIAGWGEEGDGEGDEEVDEFERALKV